MPVMMMPVVDRRRQWCRWRRIGRRLRKGKARIDAAIGRGAGGRNPTLLIAAELAKTGHAVIFSLQAVGQVGGIEKVVHHLRRSGRRCKAENAKRCDKYQAAHRLSLVGFVVRSFAIELRSARPTTAWLRRVTVAVNGAASLKFSVFADHSAKASALSGGRRDPARRPPRSATVPSDPNVIAGHHVRGIDVPFEIDNVDLDAAKAVGAPVVVLSRHPATGVPHSLLPGCPHALAAMLRKHPLIAERQILFPRVLESRPCLKQIGRRAGNVQSSMREWVEAARPAPLIESIRQASLSGNRADVDITVVDVPALLLTGVITAAKQFRHGRLLNSVVGAGT